MSGQHDAYVGALGGPQEVASELRSLWKEKALGMLEGWGSEPEQRDRGARVAFF